METRRIGLRFYSFLICIGLSLPMTLAVPLFVGRYCGYGWGLVAAIAVFVGWLCVGIRFAKAPTIFMGLFLGLLVSLSIAVFEFIRLRSS